MKPAVVCSAAKHQILCCINSPSDDSVAEWSIC